MDNLRKIWKFGNIYGNIYGNMDISMEISFGYMEISIYEDMKNMEMENHPYISPMEV